eukprot:gene14166-biopygen14210
MSSCRNTLSSLSAVSDGSRLRGMAGGWKPAAAGSGHSFFRSARGWCGASFVASCSGVPGAVPAPCLSAGARVFLCDGASAAEWTLGLRDTAGAGFLVSEGARFLRTFVSWGRACVSGASKFDRQHMTMWSLPPVLKNCPFGENAAAVTPPVCPVTTYARYPSCTSHTLTVASLDELIIQLPELWNDNALTWSSCAL